VAETRYSRIDKSLEAYEKRNRIAQISTILVAVFFFGFPGFSLIFVSSADLRAELYEVAIGLAVVFLALSVIMNSKAVKALPPIEDRAFYYIKTAITDLDSFKINELDTERDSAADNLTKAADAMDEWELGNIRFHRELRPQLNDFRKNFRGRLIPAIQKDSKAIVLSVIQPLTGVCNTLETGTLDKGHFAAWNQWLTQADPADPRKTLLEYHPPEPTRAQWLTSKRLHISVITLVVAVPLAVAIIAGEVLHTSIDTVVLSFSMIFGGGLILVAYLIFSGQGKGTTPSEK